MGIFLSYFLTLLKVYSYKYKIQIEQGKMLIVIEGLDGSGKSTQVNMIKEYIVEKGFNLKYLHFPRYDAPIYGDLIGKFLRGGFGDIEHVHPQLVALLYALDRSDSSAQIQQWLKEGYVVLLDRYVYSNIAYQCSKLSDNEEKKELMDWIFNLEYNVYKIPRPDINLFLDVPLDFVSSRLNSSRLNDSDRGYLDGSKDIHEESIDFQKRVKEIYLAQVERDPDFIKVDCSSADGSMLTPDKIFERIKEKLPL